MLQSSQLACLDMFAENEIMGGEAGMKQDREWAMWKWYWMNEAETQANDQKKWTALAFLLHEVAED
jgi:hypothetical protein